MAKAFDWSQYEEKKPTSSFDWSKYAEEGEVSPQQESFKSSLSQAPFRIGEDVAHAAMSGINALPGYYEKAKSEIPAAYELVKKDPMRALSQALAGTAEMGRNVFNAPHDISNYLSERLHLVPEDINKKIQMGRMPEDTQGMINQTFGEANQPGEALIRGLGRNQDLLLGGAGLSKALKPVTKKSIEKTILKSHDILEKSAEKGFKDVSKQVEKRGISKVDINPIEIDDVSEYFSKTKSAKKLLEGAKEGNYKSLRKIQSDLYTKGKKNLGSDLEVERLRGEEMLEKRDNINQAISDHLKKTGNHDLDKILNKSRKEYKTLKDVYYNKDMNNAIIKMVDSKIRKMPKNLPNILGERSIPMSKLMEFHPGLDKRVGKYGLQKNISSLIKKGSLPGAAFVGYEYGKSK